MTSVQYLMSELHLDRNVIPILDLIGSISTCFGSGLALNDQRVNGGLISSAATDRRLMQFGPPGPKTFGNFKQAPIN